MITRTISSGFGLLTAACAGVFLVSGLFGANEGWERFSVVSDSLVSGALYRNQDLQAQREKVLAGREAVIAAGWLDAPSLKAEFMPQSAGGTETALMIEQMIMNPPKQAAMREAARAQTAYAESMVWAKETMLAEKVRIALAEVWMADRRLDLAGENIALLKSVYEISQQQYSLGLTGQSSLLAADVALQNARSDSITIAAKRFAMVSELLALTGDTTNASFPATPDFEPRIRSFDRDSARAIVCTNCPEINALQAEERMASAMASAAQWDLAPNLMVGAGYRMSDPMPDTWTIEAGVSLPFAPWALPRYRAAHRLKKAEERTARAMLDDMRAMVRAEFAGTVAAVASAEERLKFARETGIPRAELTLKAVVEEYKNGKAAFPMLMESARMLIMAREYRVMAVMELLKAYAGLDRELAVPLPRKEEK